MRKVTYATLEMIDHASGHVCVAVYQAKAHERDGKVRTIALGTGKIVKRYKLTMTSIEGVPYHELARRHETQEYPAFDWSMQTGDWCGKGRYQSRIAGDDDTRKTTDFSED